MRIGTRAGQQVMALSILLEHRCLGGRMQRISTQVHRKQSRSFCASFIVPSTKRPANSDLPSTDASNKSMGSFSRGGVLGKELFNKTEISLPQKRHGTFGISLAMPPVVYPAKFAVMRPPAIRNHQIRDKDFSHLSHSVQLYPRQR
jgi:hypothetical protein